MSKARVNDPGQYKWTTKDGLTLKWSDMSDAHLRNTAKMLRRNAELHLSAVYGCYIQGEAAQDALDSAMSFELDRRELDLDLAAAMESYVAARTAGA